MRYCKLFYGRRIFLFCVFLWAIFYGRRIFLVIMIGFVWFFMVGGFFSGSDSYDWNIMMGCTDFCSLMVPVFLLTDAWPQDTTAWAAWELSLCHFVHCHFIPLYAVLYIKPQRIRVHSIPNCAPVAYTYRPNFSRQMGPMPIRIDSGLVKSRPQQLQAPVSLP